MLGSFLGSHAYNPNCQQSTDTKRHVGETNELNYNTDGFKDELENSIELNVPSKPPDQLENDLDLFIINL